MYTILVSIILTICEFECAFAPRPHVEITVKLHKEGLDFITDELEKELSRQVPRLKLRAEQVPVLGMNVTIGNLSFSRFAKPKILITLLPPRSMKVSIDEGDMKVCGNWRVKKRLIRTSGELCLSTKKTQDIDVSVYLQPSADGRQQLTLDIQRCKATIPLDFHIRHSVFAFLNPIGGLLTTLFKKKISKLLCKTMNVNLKAIVERQRVELTKRYGLSYKLSEFVIQKSSIDVKIAASALALY